MRKILTSAILLAVLSFPVHRLWAQQPNITWDAHGMMVDGKRVMPVMGEVHYSRIPANEWSTEVRKMKEGGVTIISTYIFWNHIEEVEGLFDWSGQRNLRQFLEVCRAEQMPVVVRLGPFCHGEVRNGGIPDWVVAKSAEKDGKHRPMKLRSTDARWLELCTKLYRQIFTQVQGLQWKDGGPVLAAQFDNEYRGSGDYLMALKKIAREIGFDLPFYTRTGWPELSKPVPFGEMIPLYGDYADGFWERSTKATAGNYWKAFFFKPNRDNKSIGTDIIQYGDDSSARHSSSNTRVYPYFTCELGGGMATAYHRRPYLYPEDALAMAVVKLGSGASLLGYYMYHGGTNPEGKLTTLNENQRTPSTNNNDLPVMTYDFQAPLGEFGQRNEVYYRLRPLHLFLKDFGGMLALMEYHAPTRSAMASNAPSPEEADGKMRKGDDTYLRWCYRSVNGGSPSTDERGKTNMTSGKAAFIFFNNYERLQKLTAKMIQFDVEGVKLPSITIPANAIGILPVNVEGMRYATAQLVAKHDGKVYLMQIDGIPTEICMQDGKKLRRVKPRGTDRPVYKNIYLLTEKEAQHLFLASRESVEGKALNFRKIKEAGPVRTITMGVKGVAEAPSDQDFDNAAVYAIDLNGNRDGLLDIDYQGDCARLYADGKLIADNFYYGRHFQYGLWRLPEGVTELELRVLPMQEEMPVYFPEEADTTPGEKVVKTTIFPSPFKEGNINHSKD